MMVQIPIKLAVALLALLASLGIASAEQMAAPPPPERPNLSQGRELYANNCLYCHGRPDGGLVTKLGTLDYADAGLRNINTTQLFRRTFAENRHLLDERGLCAFCAANLSNEQLWNVVFYATTLRTSPERAAEGQRSYEKLCSSCHGARGVGGSGPRLDDAARAVNTSDAELARRIGEGGAHGAAASLSAAERERVVDYLRLASYGELPKRQPDVGAALGVMVLSLVAIAVSLKHRQ